MSYHCVLHVPDGDGRLAKALTTEQRRFDRSAVTITRKGKTLRIACTATDVTALKAAVLSIIQLLEVDAQLVRITHGKR